MPRTTEQLLFEAVGHTGPLSYAWTRSVVDVPLKMSSVATLTHRVRDALAASNVVLPDTENLIRRCVVALLCGHLVLQGPPGTGKTTLARLLAEAFEAELRVATATSDWSSYDVVGGLRPGDSGQLLPGLGCVTDAALACAEAVRADGAFQAAWLLLDELNRADIDKAIGPLYTVLSAVTADHLSRTPLNLWFGEGDAARLWVPARFRIIGTMNDVDTSFVNALSQGLARRFQFIYVGVPDAADTANEVTHTMLQARSWLSGQYPDSGTIEPDKLIANTKALRERLTAVVELLRRPTGVPGWPLGSAQLVDVWRTVLLQAPDGTGDGRLLDEALADRVVPQMSTLDIEQLDHFGIELAKPSLAMTVSASAIAHLVHPHSLP